MGVPVQFDGTTWSIQASHQLPEIALITNAWTPNSTSPWLADDKLSYNQEQFAGNSPAIQRVNITPTISGSAKTTQPIFRFDASLDKLELSVGDWVLVEVTVQAVRDSNFRLGFVTEGFRMAVDFDPILQLADEYLPSAMSTSSYLRTAAFLTGVVKSKAAKKRLVITLRTGWLTDAGSSGIGLFFVVGLVIRSFAGWNKPSPSAWYNLELFDVGPVIPEGSLAEAKRKESGDWEVVNPNAE